MWLYLREGRKSARAVRLALSLSAQGDAAKFSAASRADASSMSMAWMAAPGWRWAAIRAMVHVPVPMSSINDASSGMLIAAPSNTPSVLTFIAERVLETQNCLNLKTAILHYQASVAHIGQFRIVGDNDYCLAQGIPEGEEQLVQFLLSLAVKVSGRFVCK